MAKTDQKLTFIIRKSCLEDSMEIVSLYKNVARNKGGLAREEDEITQAYVENFTRKSIEDGLQFVVIDQSKENRVVGEIHCYKPEPKVFKHILSDLTIAIDPDYQGMGLGKKLFETLLEFVSNYKRDILRVELFARESNSKAIDIYTKIGFVREGRLRNRIRIDTNTFECDIVMGWTNPKFE
ncbi:GNAT family N-acetyltransferase [Siphonobacter sp. SORGH_AS_0500]|uniref:GNAT family N-acetyltransferase n=1 Tax=Siphonobacter sp. SORGH_AS_0500 TaxID=1864824 RepID=UPI000CAB3FC9|nr:GNAT family N-acetyltransferase [Siphonobacter sp. SORGH_AS_0500]MDR6194272.1 ribosomal protein S18 acetylase RimI-like enzyme [Siphonobacter sp. SORGH_AS_0500]PKK37056.1 hypothetical protein BWI96_09275 [Siphonobacter sp. SORGH_AS_0500]